MRSGDSCAGGEDDGEELMSWSESGAFTCLECDAPCDLRTLFGWASSLMQSGVDMSLYHNQICYCAHLPLNSKKRVVSTILLQNLIMIHIFTYLGSPS